MLSICLGSVVNSPNGTHLSSSTLALAGEDVNVLNTRRQTPLHLACISQGGVELVTALVAAGAEVNAVDLEVGLVTEPLLLLTTLLIIAFPLVTLSSPRNDHN